jgi:ribose transport system permease protein
VLALFVMMGALSGVAAMLDLTRFATTNIGGHQTTALAAIAAVVIGGTSLFGGRATIAGSMVASLIPVILGTGLVILGVPSFYQLIAVGAILIAAVYVDQRRRERLSA